MAMTRTAPPIIIPVLFFFKTFLIRSSVLDSPKDTVTAKPLCFIANCNNDWEYAFRSAKVAFAKAVSSQNMWHRLNMHPINRNEPACDFHWYQASFHLYLQQVASPVCSLPTVLLFLRSHSA